MTRTKLTDAVEELVALGKRLEVAYAGVTAAAAQVSAILRDAAAALERKHQRSSQAFMDLGALAAAWRSGD